MYVMSAGLTDLNINQFRLWDSSPLWDRIVGEMGWQGKVNVMADLVLPKTRPNSSPLRNRLNLDLKVDIY